MRVLLDTGPALLLLVGRFDRERIARHKRLQGYRASDFDLLTRLIGRFDGVVVTPNVLTEVSDLSVFGLWGELETLLRAELREFVDASEEVYAPARMAVRLPHFARLGLTDTGLLAMCAPDRVLVTSDALLHIEAAKGGYDVVNFEHLRKAV